MARKTIRFGEDDLKVIFENYMRGTWLPEGAEIVGFEFRTRTIKRDGDYYRDGISHLDNPGNAEEVRWIKIVIDVRARPAEDEPTDDAGNG